MSPIFLLQSRHLCQKKVWFGLHYWETRWDGYVEVFFNGIFCQKLEGCSLFWISTFIISLRNEIIKRHTNQVLIYYCLNSTTLLCTVLYFFILILRDGLAAKSPIILINLTKWISKWIKKRNFQVIKVTIKKVKRKGANQERHVQCINKQRFNI